jgi:hypothetical protein
VIRLQHSQALFQQAKRAVPRPVVGLGGKEHLVTARGHHLADVRLADPPSVGRSRVDVVHAQVYRPIDDGQRLITGAVFLDGRLASETEKRNLVARAAERTFGHGRNGLSATFLRTAQEQCGGTARANFDEVSTCELALRHAASWLVTAVLVW